MTITLLTHDSFDVTRSVLRAFEDRTGVTKDVVAAGDAGQLANGLILAALAVILLVVTAGASLAIGRGRPGWSGRT